METDRLKEERERGMSIALGFAHLALPGGEVDFIDVPGHEKFIRTMISGATGLDAGLLVIAANERVKPQTVEHVALLGLLGIRRGLVAVTKSDLAAGERERITAEIEEFLGETFLRDAPLLWTSTRTGEGLPDVRQALESLLMTAIPAPVHPFCYLPIDRVFTMTGHGLVVTGTLRQGAMKLGQTVELWPRGGKAEVRGLEVHGQPVEMALPGWRTAVNLRGVRKDDLSRGDALATPGVLRPTRLLDVELTLLAAVDQPVKRGQPVLLYYGTSEISARLYPLGKDRISPGETAWGQFRLAEEAVVPAREPFLIRSASPRETIGGGIILDPYPQKHTGTDTGALRRVQCLACGSDAEKLAVKLLEAGPEGRERLQLSLDLGLPVGTISFGVPCGAGLVLHPDVFESLAVQAREAVRRFHQALPLRRGMPLEELRRSLPPALRPAAYGRLLETLAETGQIERVQGLVREPGYAPEAALSPVEREIAREMEAQFLSGGLKPPGLAEVLRKDRRRKRLFQLLIESGVLVPATERASGSTIIFHRKALAKAVETLRGVLVTGEGRTVSEINRLLGITRKFSMPLLEYLLEMGITRRESDLHFWNDGER